MPSTEYGVTRQIWLARLSAPTTYYSFLIRDDAYSAGLAVFGRTIRLGDPVSLGPNSTFRQTTWEGGKGQDQWDDTQMFKENTADTATERGRAKMWPGWRQIYGTTNKTHSGYIIARAASLGFGTSSYLYWGEWDWVGRAVPAGNYAIGRYDAATDTNTGIRTFDGPVAAISSINDTALPANYLAVGVSPRGAGGDGGFWLYNPGTGSWVHEFTMTGNTTFNQNTIVPFGQATYYTQDATIRKRTYDIATATVTHADFYRVTNASTIGALTVWNNRLWIAALRPGNMCDVHVSDGVTVVPAFSFGGAFRCTRMVVHYGALYFIGFRQAADWSLGATTEVWRYNGASLTKLWQSPDEQSENNGEYHIGHDMVSHGRYLVWGKTGQVNDRRVGFIYYDAETDSIHTGPTFKMADTSTRMYTTGIASWNNTLAVGLWDDTVTGANDRPNALAFVRTDSWPHVGFWSGYYSGTSFEAANTGPHENYVTSSLYDADLPGAQKTWLAGRVRIKLDQPNQDVTVRVMLDDSTTKISVGGASYDAAQPGWRTLTFPMVSGGVYLKSHTLRYEIVLRNTLPGTNPAANPRVDSVEFDYNPAPVRQRQWRLRVVSADAQLRLDGSANSLTTTQAQTDLLEALATEGSPVLYWDAKSSGGATPSGPGVQVNLNDFIRQTYRVETGSSTENAETAFTAIEIIY